MQPSSVDSVDPVDPLGSRHEAAPSRRGVARTAVLLVLVWAGLLALVAALGWAITHAWQASVDPWDNDISRWFARHRTSALDGPADVGTLLGDTVPAFALGAVVVAGIAVWRRTWRPVVFFGLLAAGMGALYSVVTRVDPRDRPPVRILDGGLVPDHSFPSGHVGTATAVYGGIVVLAWVYARHARPWVAPLLLLPPLVLLARLYQGAHHLTDVLTSLVYGTAWLATLSVLLLAGVVRDGVDRDGVDRDGVDRDGT
ncbi:phosphatase PAP2 family protein [Nocardioides guangzhouensis]|nr:phosphatase PAP2 family protein [Nocardioides guangzhouensis]